MLSGTGEFTGVEQFILPGFGARQSYNADTWTAIVRWGREQTGPTQTRDKHCHCDRRESRGEPQQTRLPLQAGPERFIQRHTPGRGERLWGIVGREAPYELLLCVVKLWPFVSRLCHGAFPPVSSARSASSLRSAWSARCKWLFTVPSGFSIKAAASRTLRPSMCTSTNASFWLRLSCASALAMRRLSNGSPDAGAAVGGSPPCQSALQVSRTVRQRQ